MKAKEKYILDNAKAFEELGLSVLSVADAEKVLISQKDAVIGSIVQKAKATYYAKQAEERIQKVMENELEITRLTNQINQGKAGKIKGVNYGLNYHDIAVLEESNKKIKAGIEQLYKNASIATKNGETLLANEGINSKAKLKKGTIAYYENEIDIIKQSEAYKDALTSEARATEEKKISVFQAKIDKIQGKEKGKKTASVSDPFLAELKKQKAKSSLRPNCKRFNFH